MKMNKRTLLIVTGLVMFFLVGMSQAATIQLQGLPATIAPNTAGSFSFDVFLLDTTLPEVDGFTCNLKATGDAGLAMPEASVLGPTLPDYIFYGDSWVFFANNPGGDLTSLSFGGINDSGSGYEGQGLLGQVTLEYPELPYCTWIGLEIASGSFLSAPNSEEDLVVTLDKSYNVHVAPIPGAIWLLGSGLLGILGIGRRMKTV